MTYDKYDMSVLKISTKRSNLGVIGIHSNWGNNWSMKRKTSVMRVTKPLIRGNLRSKMGLLRKMIK